jgi:hypothetical protein
MGENNKCTSYEEVIKENFNLEDIKILNNNISNIIRVFKELKTYEINKDNQVDF